MAAKAELIVEKSVWLATKQKGPLFLQQPGLSFPSLASWSCKAFPGIVTPLLSSNRVQPLRTRTLVIIATSSLKFRLPKFTFCHSTNFDFIHKLLVVVKSLMNITEVSKKSWSKVWWFLFLLMLYICAFSQLLINFLAQYNLGQSVSVSTHIIQKP